MLAARRFVVRGRVQGVGFRWFTEEAAAVEGLSGWVRNCTDGSVEIWVEGDAEAVDRFARQVARGPGRARVDAVEVFRDEPTGRSGSFVVRD